MARFGLVWFGFPDQGHFDLVLSWKVSKFGDLCEKKLSVPLEKLYFEDGIEDSMRGGWSSVSRGMLLVVSEDYMRGGWSSVSRGMLLVVSEDHMRGGWSSVSRGMLLVGIEDHMRVAGRQ